MVKIINSVVIIILNWNGWEDTIECLESLFQINYPYYRVIVVDNGSTDNSIEKIRDYCAGKIQPSSPFFTYNIINKPINIIEYSHYLIKSNIKNQYLDYCFSKSLILIKNKKNFGFSEGNNIAIRYALKVINPEYILLLNNDTVVDPKFLDKLIEVAESEKKIGIVGPKVYYYNFNGKIDVLQYIGGKINWKKYPGYFIQGVNSYDSFATISGCRESDWISGVALLLKVKEIPVKFLNTKYFFGCDDIDLSLQNRRHGYKLLVAMESKIWHKGGVSRKKRSQIQLKRIIFDIISNLKLFQDYHKNCVFVWFPYLFDLCCIFGKGCFKRVFFLK